MASKDNYIVYENNVVFAIEATANMLARFNHTKTKYILPIINHFDGLQTSSDDSKYSRTTTRFVLVLYHAADSRPGYETQCFPPVQSRGEFVKLLEEQEFTGGAAEPHAHVAEGLATCLHAFSDLAALQPARSTTAVECQQLCFLVAHSPPYEQSVVSDDGEYFGMTLKQLGVQFSERKIHLSVISSHHINRLRRLYRFANNVAPLEQVVNYARHQGYLVLMSGLNMGTPDADTN